MTIPQKQKEEKKASKARKRAKPKSDHSNTNSILKRAAQKSNMRSLDKIVKSGLH